MQGNEDINVKGAIKINDLPDLGCFTSFEELLKALPTFLTVEIPSTITNVIVSNVQPLDDQRDALWVRRNNAGSFVGLYIYASGTWRQIYPVGGGNTGTFQLFRVKGDSRTIPEGYLLADEDNPHLTANEASWVKTQWLHNPTQEYYVIFDITYEGF